MVEGSKRKKEGEVMIMRTSNRKRSSEEEEVRKRMWAG